MSFVVKWLILTLSILATPYFIPGVLVTSFGAAVAAAIVLALLNIFIRPILILFTLPLTILSLGLFLLIVNAICFHMMASLVSGIAVDGFGSSFLASLFITFISWISNLGIQRHHGRPRIVVRTERRFPGESMKDVTPPEN